MKNADMPKWQDLQQTLEAFGMVIDRELSLDGKVQRFPMRDQGKGKGRPGWVICRTSPRGHHFANFGDWRRPEQKQKWSDAGLGTEFDPDAEEMHRLNLMLLKEIREQENAKAKEIAAEMWAQGKPVKQHPYLEKKQVQAHGARVNASGDLLIPYLNQKGEISTIQQISADGDKRMLKNGTISGCCAILDGDESRVFICEGWATGATICELTGNKVLVAYSCGNLVKVAQKAKEGGLWANIIIAADNDHKTEGNPGLKAAREAAKLIQAQVVVPECRGTDFNDMVCEGQVHRAKEILTGISQLEPLDEIMRAQEKKIDWLVPSLLPIGFTILAGPPKFGKSWLVLDLGISVALGCDVWGMGRASQGEAVYFSLEDPKYRIQDRVKKMNFPEMDEQYTRNFLVQRSVPKAGAGLTEYMTQVLNDRPGVKLFIIDTLQKIRPAGKGNRNIYQAEYEDLEALQKFATSYGVAVVGVHHVRKPQRRKDLEQDPINEISGSTGIQGVADNLLVCSGSMDAGKLFAVTRDGGEVSLEMTMDKVNMRWQMKFLKEEDREKYNPLPDLLNKWFKTHVTVTAAEFAKENFRPIRTVQLMLKNLAEEGALIANKPDSVTKPIEYAKTSVWEYVCKNLI